MGTRGPSPSGGAPDPAGLQAALGHVFTRPELLREALTHPSLAGFRQRKSKGTTPYERLEFLGDRVLGLVVAGWLYALFPDASEGDLARRHAALVNRDALRAVALELHLEKYLRLAQGENALSERTNLATLADALEAVIGALYLDAGLEVAERFIRHYWRHEAENAAAPSDSKTAAQEWAQARGLPVPAYAVVQRSGPAHAPQFVVEMRVQGFPPVEAGGTSKRLAEKEAARLFLERVENGGQRP